MKAVIATTALILLAAGHAAAKGNAFHVLHTFTQDGVEGSNPAAGLTYYAPQGQFYGVAQYGGNYGCGVIYKVRPNGSGYKVVHSIDGNDGCNPAGDLLNSSGTTVFYGTTGNGVNGYGTVFKLTARGKYTVLHAFQKNDGFQPTGALAQDDRGNLYGTTYGGGSGGSGVVYRLKKDGTFTELASFDGGSKGGNPFGGVILGNAHDGSNGSVLFGTTGYGGDNHYGVVFRVDVDKRKLTVLHTFTGGAGGASPYSTVIEGPDGSLYGTTFGRNTIQESTVYKIATDGTFSVLHNFAGEPDGGNPYRALLLAESGVLYGTTAAGGAVCDCGTVFRIKPDGTGYGILHSFDGRADGMEGYYPASDLVELVNNKGKHTLYGTALYTVGTTGGGTVFSVAE